MSDPADLRDLAAAVREAAGAVIRRVRYESGSSLSWSQSALLSELARRGRATASELAEIQGLRVQTVWTSLETMERRGFISRERDPSDRRQIQACLTAHGRAELDDDRSARDAWIVGVLAEDFTPHQRSQLADALGLLTMLAGSELHSSRHDPHDGSPAT